MKLALDLKDLEDRRVKQEQRQLMPNEKAICLGWQAGPPWLRSFYLFGFTFAIDALEDTLLLVI